MRARLSRVLKVFENCGSFCHLMLVSAGENALLALPVRSNADGCVKICGYQGKKFPMTLPEDLH
jgi:hypothetical protein